jgi:hypothetical protein
VDADEVTGQDSANAFSLIRTTWANIKAFLKTYFDTIYLTPAHGRMFENATGTSTVTLTTANNRYGWATAGAGLLLLNSFLDNTAITVPNATTADQLRVDTG